MPVSAKHLSKEQVSTSFHNDTGKSSLKFRVFQIISTRPDNISSRVGCLSWWGVIMMVQEVGLIFKLDEAVSSH